MSASTKVGIGFGILLVIVVGSFAATITIQDKQETDDLPPDPFESNEPREVDCVGDWRSPRDFPVTADIYCEVGGTENSHDVTDIEQGPYIWTTTGNAGDVALIDMTPSVATSGICEIWVDGERLDYDEMEVGEDGCAVETTIP